MDFRKNGKVALATLLTKEKNIRVIERYLYEQSNLTSNEDDIEDVYNLYLYQIIGDLIDGSKLKPLLVSIKAGKLGWEHKSFNEVTIKLKEQEDFIENPFEVEEGVIECRCGSKRVYSYSRQQRSCDEPSTTYAECVACKSKWTYSG
jgi:DNA-directed RNA polymerase subunit M/transcription elongation factor TFIIS